MSVAAVIPTAVAAVLTGMVPYKNIKVDAPVAAAFGDIGLSSARFIITIGNRAVHDRYRAIPETASLAAVEELFHVCYWLAHTYGQTQPSPSLAFNAGQLPAVSVMPPQTAQKLEALEQALAERDEKLSMLLADKASLGEQIVVLRAEVVELSPPHVLATEAGRSTTSPAAMASATACGSRRMLTGPPGVSARPAG